METTHAYIEASILKRKAGEIVFPTDFRGKGTEDAIKKALSRIAAKGTLSRLAHGIYFVPKTDPLFGTIYPTADEVAKMIAKKEKVRIKPAGAYALHQLGLTTQVPTRLVYITDGVSRNLKVGKTTIKFKATSNKKLSVKGKISGLVIQALEELDIDKMDDSIELKIRGLLKKEDPRMLKHDLGIAPARINDYIVKLLKKERT
jgi:hypothetical protein